jgi:CheY-like chemotaxis protein
VQAADQLRERRYKVVLVDMRLSDSGGGERVVNEVRGLNPPPHVVLITGFRQETNVEIQRLLAEGADAVCYKPFDMATMLATLKHLVDPMQQ